jgi:hypothetical protein
VESAVGLHIIRVDQHEAASAQEARAQVRTYIQQQRIQAAESTLVAGVEQGAEVEVVEGAAELVRRAAENPGLRLSRRARGRALVTYKGGKLTVGEIAEFMQSRANQFRIDILNAPDDAIEQNLLMGLAQRELLVEKARQEGLEIPAARQDSLATELRVRLLDAARGLELRDIPARSGESAEEARERRVQEVLGDMIRGARDVMPLGSFSFILRDVYSGQLYPTGVEKVVARVAAERGPLPPDSIAGAGTSPTGSPPGASTPAPGGAP